jgi:ribonuclease R
VKHSRPPTLGGARASGVGARAGNVVAVLHTRGRFLVAEPLFADARPGDPADHGPSRGRRAGRMTVAARGSSRGGDVRARAGDLVQVQSASRRSGARVVRVIGRPDVARDVIEGLMIDRGYARGFDGAVEREARAAAELAARAGHARRDLRGLPTFTIDPVTARDFDDAVSAESLEDGATRVWVHIADVSAHVPEGSLVDREARERAMSVYVPGAVEPMLPQALSNDACSLLPGAERAAVTVELEVRGGGVARAAFYRSVIRSDERLDYERVDRIFDGGESAGEPWRASLQVAREAAAALQAERERGGALVLDSEEPEFTFDEEGNLSDIHQRRQTESHRLIEHLMIAANESVADLLERRSVPCLYRVHERPEPERIERLVEQLASLGVATPPLPEPLSSSQAAELVGAISRRVDDHVRRTGRGRIALSLLVLRSLRQAYYSPTNIGHAGLRFAGYCHFTSPIRRYPDLLCHRALLSAIGGGESAPRAAELAELGAWTSQRERDAMTIERDADDIARCFALERALYEEGWDRTFGGEVVGLISAGAFVMFGGPRRGGGSVDDRRGTGGPGTGGPDAGVRGGVYEGLLPVRRLSSLPAGRPAPSRAGRGRGAGASGHGAGASEREWWELNAPGTILHGERTGATLRLGDPVEVRVARVDAVRGKADLAPAAAP